MEGDVSKSARRPSGRACGSLFSLQPSHLIPKTTPKHPLPTHLSSANARPPFRSRPHLLDGVWKVLPITATFKTLLVFEEVVSREGVGIPQIHDFSFPEPLFIIHLGPRSQTRIHLMVRGASREAVNAMRNWRVKVTVKVPT